MVRRERESIVFETLILFFHVYSLYIIRYVILYVLKIGGIKVEGILPLWKEKGMTSHDCVYKLRKILGTKKVGHSGTLDPDVEGVLPIAVGKATKVLEYLVEFGKVYEGEITLGYSTSTEDSSGELVEQRSVEHCFSLEEIDQVIRSFEGEITQTPPMYSAVKVNGRRLYEYARAGKTVERPSRNVQIYGYQRTSEVQYDHDKKTASFTFAVSCSKGTYIRTLAVDTGKKLGFPAHMSNLVRTESGGYKASEALTLKQVKESELPEDLLKPLESALQAFPSYPLNDTEWSNVKNGSLIEKELMPAELNYPAVFYYHNKAVAIYNTHPKKPLYIKPVKVLRTEM